MGQKVNPIGLRLGGIRSWDSKWYANQNQVPKWVVEDRKIRNLVNKQCRDGSLSHIEIERYKKGKDDAIRLKIYTAKPGLVIGRDGEIKKKLVKSLERLTKKHVEINIFEVKLAERNAQIIADLMARKLEARASFRRVQKLAIQRALKLGAKGIKTIVSGRLGGAEMARAEGYAEGQVPLHTLRADIDYALAEALTKYGILGVKVWVYQGEVLPGQTREKNMEKEEEKYGQKARSSSRGGRRRERRADNKSGRKNAKPRNQKTQEPKKDVKKDTNKTTKKKEA